MALYILHNTHPAEECEALLREVQEQPWPGRLRGTIFFCHCPSGTHGGFFTVEAGSAQEALSLVTPKFRAGTKAYEAMTTEIGSEMMPVA